MGEQNHYLSKSYGKIIGLAHLSVLWSSRIILVQFDQTEGTIWLMVTNQDCSISKIGIQITGSFRRQCLNFLIPAIIERAWVNTISFL